MKIIDSSTLIGCIEKDIFPSGIYYSTGDLSEEIDLVELIHDRKLKNIRQATELSNYNEAYYLKQYSKMLNKYAGYSFVGMRGFGDIAILALVKSKLENFGKPNQTAFYFLGDNEVVVITDDNGLSKNIKKEFKDKVTVLTSNNLN